MKIHPVEWFPIVDEEGNTIGEAPRHICHDGKSRFLHPVVHLHVFNSVGELFLQKRSLTKDIQPGKWDTSVGGHIAPRESVDDAVKREAMEELGLKDFAVVFEIKYIWESTMERELVYSYSTLYNEMPVTNPDEIEEGRFWTIREIAENIGRGIFTPNFEHEFAIHNKHRDRIIARLSRIYVPH
jgi:isopentenyldiphosphate isomerase